MKKKWLLESYQLEVMEVLLQVHLLACVANEVLNQIFKKGFLKNVKKISKYFHTELNKIKDDFQN